MTTTLAALLRAVCEDPADDTLRLVLADWLDDEGQAERAEFIRCQVKLSRHPRQVEWLRQMPVGQWSGSEEEGGLLRRLDGLLSREKELWESGWQGLVMERMPPDWCPSERYEGGSLSSRGVSVGPDCDYPHVGMFFRRGFVSEVRCHLADWLAHGPAIVACHPVEAVVLADREPDHLEGGTGDRAGYWWEPGFVYDGAHQVPFAVGEAGGWKASFIGGLMVYRFPSRDDALAALSRACVALARQRADLPPLPREES